MNKINMRKIIKKIICIIKKIGPVGFVLAIVVNVISHKIEDFDYVQLTGSFCGNMLKIIKDILNFKISLWIIIVVAIIIIAIKRIYTKIIRSDIDTEEKEWDKYDRERYGGLLYTWKYYKYLGNKEIKDLKPICECGCDLIKRDSYHNRYSSRGYLVCPICGRGYDNNFDDNKEAVTKIIIYKHNKMIEEHKKNNNNRDINFNELNENEKMIIKMFYNPHLKKYSRKKVAIDGTKFLNDINNLIERGIIKKQNEFELIENYTSNGTAFELTEGAINKLNNK